MPGISAHDPKPDAAAPILRPLAPEAPVHDPLAVRGFIGPIRGHSLNIGAYAALTATSPDPEARSRNAAIFVAYRDALRDIVRHAMDGDGLPDEVTAPTDAVRRFVRTVGAVDASDDFVNLDWTKAQSLADLARLEVIPAVNLILRTYDKMDEAAMVARAEHIDRRAKTINAGFAEMERIGRMIGLISVNASVEAARTGGESGAAFQVISQEVRKLAQQSARITQEMKERLHQDRE